MCQMCHWFNKLFGANCHCGRGVCQGEGGKDGKCSCGKEGCHCEPGHCHCGDKKETASAAAGATTAPVSGQEKPSEKM